MNTANGAVCLFPACKQAVAQGRRQIGARR